MRLDELRIPYDLFLEDPYGSGIDYSAPVKRGTMLVSTEGEEVEFITVSDDGKVVVKDKDGMTLKLAPKVVAGAVRQRKV